MKHSGTFTNESTLFDLGQRIGDPDTGQIFDARREAYAPHNTERLNALEIRCLKALEFECFNPDEIAQRFGIERGTIRPRCSRLIECGFAIKTDTKRPTIKDDGTKGTKFAHVLAITEKGREALKIL